MYSNTACANKVTPFIYVSIIMVWDSYYLRHCEHVDNTGLSMPGQSAVLIYQNINERQSDTLPADRPPPLECTSTNQRRSWAGSCTAHTCCYKQGNGESMTSCRVLVCPIR